MERVEAKVFSLDELQSHFPGQKVKSKLQKMWHGAEFMEYTVRSDAGVLIGYYSNNPYNRGGWVSYTKAG